MSDDNGDEKRITADSMDVSGDTSINNQTTDVHSTRHNSHNHNNMNDSRRSTRTSSKGNGEDKKKRRHRDDNSSNSSDESYRREKRRRKEKKKRRKRSSSSKRHRRSMGSSSSFSRDSENDTLDIDRKRNKSRKEKSHKTTRDDNPLNEAGVFEKCFDSKNLGGSCDCDETIEREEQQKHAAARRMVPMTREQYEAEQSKIREVYDAETGRMRLVRGSGEIMERIVSKEAHQQINRLATRGDGESYSRLIRHKASVKRSYYSGNG
jgi:hypothetical protein